MRIMGKICPKMGKIQAKKWTNKSKNRAEMYMYEYKIAPKVNKMKFIKKLKISDKTCVLWIATVTLLQYKNSKFSKKYLQKNS